MLGSIPASLDISSAGCMLQFFFFSRDRFLFSGHFCDWCMFPKLFCSQVSYNTVIDSFFGLQRFSRLYTSETFFPKSFNRLCIGVSRFETSTKSTRFFKKCVFSKKTIFKLDHQKCLNLMNVERESVTHFGCRIVLTFEE